MFFFVFFFDIPSSLLLRIDYHQMLSFQESVGHITCTLWSSPQLSTYDISFICGFLLIVSSCFFLGATLLSISFQCPLEAAAATTPSGTATSPSKHHVLGQDI